jgi:hypothetical protein
MSSSAPAFDRWSATWSWTVREQLAHAVGGACLVSAKQDVVSRLIHDAPSEGVACPGAARDQSGRLRTRQL